MSKYTDTTAFLLGEKCNVGVYSFFRSPYQEQGVHKGGEANVLEGPHNRPTPFLKRPERAEVYLFVAIGQKKEGFHTTRSANRFAVAHVLFFTFFYRLAVNHVTINLPGSRSIM